VPLYLVPRTRAWLSEEELAAATDCLPAVNDAMNGDVRWIRSYVVAEDDGTFSAFCVYEASGPEPAAVKVLHVDHGADPMVLARFLREDIGDAAKAYMEDTAKNHPNPIVRSRATAELRRYQ